MKSVTQRLLAFVAMLLVSTSAWAQANVNVTFQADLRTAVANCQFNPATGQVFMRGSAFGDWAEASAVQLSDPDGDRIYSATVSVPSGTEIKYKFLAPTVTGWENGGDRVYTPTTEANQTVAPAVPAVPGYDVNACGATSRNYEVEFRLDVSTMSPTVFDPTKDTLFVAGGFSGWGDSNLRMTQDIIDANLYTAVLNLDNVTTPGVQYFKYVVRKANAPGVTGRGPISWESPRNNNPDGNRKLEFLSTDTDGNSNGRYEKIFGPVYWSDVPPTEVLSAGRTVIFEVDMTPAIQYAAANGGMLPGAMTAFGRTVFLNGPAAQASDGMVDWAAWTMDGLGSMPTRRFHNDGATGGDAVANDNIWTATFSYPRGTAYVVKAKFGADAADNESGFGADRFIDLNSMTNGRIRMIFGAMRLSDGKYTDLRGPGAVPNAYDPWICIPSDSTQMPSVSAAGTCGTNVGVEPVDGPSVASFTVHNVYPNPTAGTARLRYAIPAAQDVRVEVYDLLGRRIETLVDEFQAAGTYDAVFEARGLANGVYLMRATVAGKVQNRTFVVSQ